MELAKFPSLQLLEFEITYRFLRDDLLEILKVLKSSPHVIALKSLHIHGNVLRYPKLQESFVEENVAVVCREIEHVLLASPYVNTVETTFLLGKLKSVSIHCVVKTLQMAFPNLHQRGLLNIEYSTGKVLFQAIATEYSLNCPNST